MPQAVLDAREIIATPKGKERKVLHVHAIEANRRSRSIAPLIRNLSFRWRRVVSFTPQLLQSLASIGIRSPDRPVLQRRIIVF